MKILVVEDSPEVAMITVEYLSELGHDASAVENAELALQRVSGQAFDAVMTDVSLPGMSGIDLSLQLVRQFPKLPVIIASGYGALNLEAKLGPAKKNVLMLTKPYDMTQLENTLAQVQEFITNFAK